MKCKLIKFFRVLIDLFPLHLFSKVLNINFFKYRPIKLHKEDYEYQRKSQFYGFTGKRDNSVVIRSSLSQDSDLSKPSNSSLRITLSKKQLFINK